MDLFSEGIDRYRDDLANFLFQPENNPFERGLLNLLEAYKARRTRGSEVDNILRAKPLPEELEVELMTSFEKMAKVAALYQKNGLADAAKSVRSGMVQTLREMDERQAERLAGKPEIDDCISLSPEEKVFKLQAALGRFVTAEDKSKGLERLSSIIEDEMKKAVETGDQAEERYLWGVVLGLEKTDPDKLAEVINRIAGLVEGYSSEEFGLE